MATSTPKTSTSKSSKFIPSLLGYSVLIFFGVLAFGLLQYQYWYGEFGHYQLQELQKQVKQQESLNQHQNKVNDVLRADIDDLKTGLGAIEEHARSDLGFIKAGETFVQLSTVSPSQNTVESVGTDISPAREPIDDDVLATADDKTP